MSRVAVFVKLVARSGRRDALIERLAEAFGSADEEPGTEIYALHASQQDPDVLWFYELYRDSAAFEVHRQALAPLAPRLADLLAEPPAVERTEPLRAKGLRVG